MGDDRVTPHKTVGTLGIIQLHSVYKQLYIQATLHSVYKQLHSVYKRL